MLEQIPFSFAVEEKGVSFLRKETPGMSRGRSENNREDHPVI